jgi:hypothetical protein
LLALQRVMIPIHHISSHNGVVKVQAREQRILGEVEVTYSP